MLRDGASRAPRPLYQLGYICDQPFFLIVVWTQRHSPTCLHQSSTVEATDNFTQRMSQMQDKAKAALKHAADEMAWYYDHQRSPAPTYEVGAKVWLNAQNYMTTHLTKKLDHKWLGPFVIKKVISPTAVKLCLSPCELGIHPVISVSNVHPYYPDPIR